MPPLSPGEQARELARKQLDTNNAVNPTSNAIISLFEGGESSNEIRNHIDHILSAYAASKTYPNPLPFDFDVLRKLTSIKEKIAYVTGIEYETNFHTAGGGGVVPHVAEVNNRINEIITYINKGLFANLDFSESRILRHSASNTFEPNYTPQERQNIEKLAQKLKKASKDAKARTMFEAMDFDQESDPQKVIKMEEVVIKLTKAGVNIEADTLALLESLGEKLKPLKELDKSYRKLSRMQTTVHTLGKSLANSMISETKQKKLFAVLKDMGKSPQDYMVGDEDLVSVKNGLSDILHDKNKDALLASLDKHIVSKKEFQQWFLSYFAYANIGAAKEELVTAKQKAFGHKVDRFEKGVNRWRGSARKRVLNLRPRMVARTHGLDFDTDQDYELANNYFTSFRSVFYADPEADRETFDQMRAIVSAVIRRRVPGVNGTQNLRPAMSKALRTISGGAWGNIYHNAVDDAEIFATIVMMQAQTSQELYYNDKDQTIKPENFMQRISKRVSRTEKGRQGVKRFLKPGLKGLLRIGENATRHTLTGVGSATAWTTKMIAGTDKNAEGNARGGLARMNRWTEKNFHWAKLPFYVLWPATYALEKGFTLANQATLGLMVGGTRFRQNGIDALKTGTHDENVTHLVDGVGKTLDTATSWISKPVSWMGQKVNEQSTKIEQKKFLAAFYEAAASEDKLTHIMETADLANIINLKDYGPYLFDEDGRITPADIEEEKTIETQADALKETKEVFYKQANLISEGIKKQNKTMQDEINSINSSGDSKKIESIVAQQKSLEVANAYLRTIISAINSCAGSVELDHKTAIDTLNTAINDNKNAVDEVIKDVDKEILTKTKLIEKADAAIATKNDEITFALKSKSPISVLKKGLNKEIDKKTMAEIALESAKSKEWPLLKMKLYLLSIGDKIGEIKQITDDKTPDRKRLAKLLKELDLSID